MTAAAHGDVGASTPVRNGPPPLAETPFHRAVPMTPAKRTGARVGYFNARKLMADTRAPIDWDEQRAGLGFI